MRSEAGRFAGGERMRIRIADHAEFWSGVMFVGFGGAFWWIGTDYDMGTARSMGPGFLPMVLSWLLVGLGVIVLAKGLSLGSAQEVSRRGEDARREAARSGSDPWLTARALGAVAASLIFFGIALPRIGLVLSVFGLVAIASFADPKLRWPSVIVIGAVMSAVCAGVFRYGIGLSLPMWP